VKMVAQIKCISYKADQEETVPVEPVADVVAAELLRWDNEPAIELAVFGTSEPEAIAAVVERFCVEQFGAPPAGSHFYRGSTGCVLGLHLASGADVVLKAYQERWPKAFLRAVQSVQEHVAGGGLPCARPLRPPVALPGRPNLAVVESWLPDPGMQPNRSESAQRVSAAGLATQIALCTDLAGVQALIDHPLDTPAGDLYGEPHSPLFDFVGTAHGAEWIDDLARLAVEIRQADDAPPVVAHTDWSARNVRFDDREILATYDWDSVTVVKESTALGQAAVTWCVTAEPGGSEFPTYAEIVGFMRDYEHAARRPLTDIQWRAAGAAATYLLAYTSRCEHSLDVTGVARPDQHGGRDRLAESGARLLDLTRS
jgi:hypothetical protein